MGVVGASVAVAAVAAATGFGSLDALARSVGRVRAEDPISAMGNLRLFCRQHRTLVRKSRVNARELEFNVTFL